MLTDVIMSAHIFLILAFLSGGGLCEASWLYCQKEAEHGPSFYNVLSQHIVKTHFENISIFIKNSVVIAFFL